MWSGIWSVATIRIGFWTWIWSTRHCGLGQEVACWFQCWKNSFDQSNSTVTTDVKVVGSVFEEKHLLRCWGWLSLLNWIGATTLYLLLKLPPRKLESWFVLWSFFSLEVALYLCKSTVQPCMEHCCHVWVGAPSYYLELLDKLQKRICRTIGPSLAASLEPLTHRWNVASLSLFYRYFFGRCSSELAQLVPRTFSRGGLIVILIDCMICVTISRCYKDVYVNSFFLHTAKLLNYLPKECFPLTYDLNNLSLELTDTFYLQVLSKEISCALIFLLFFL